MRVITSILHEKKVTQFGMHYISADIIAKKRNKEERRVLTIPESEWNKIKESGLIRI